MLVLMLKAGGRVYGLDSRDIKEVLPFVPLLPGANGRGQVLHYHGQSVQVIDLAGAFFGGAASHVLTTRIIVVVVKESTMLRQIGLLAEAVTETRSVRGLALDPEHNPVDGVPARAWRDHQGQVYAIIDLPAVLAGLHGQDS